jgi:hypothetical protein
MRRRFDCVNRTAIISGCQTSGAATSAKHVFYAAPGRANITDDGRMTDVPTHDALDRNQPLYWLRHHSLSQATSRSMYLYTEISTEPLSDSHSSIQYTPYTIYSNGPMFRNIHTTNRAS